MAGYQMEEMTDRTRWTKAQLERMLALKRTGSTNKEIFQALRREYGVPKNLGEVNAELHFLNGGIDSPAPPFLFPTRPFPSLKNSSLSYPIRRGCDFCG